jgi:hypothetical protein
LCLAYSATFGGRTGLAGAAIFALATLFTALGTLIQPDWAGTSYAVFAADLGCLLALAFLACSSTRYWPIWATGFQIVAVATHIATFWIPDVVPAAYQARLDIREESGKADERSDAGLSEASVTKKGIGP